MIINKILFGLLDEEVSNHQIDSKDRKELEPSYLTRKDFTISYPSHLTQETNYIKSVIVTFILNKYYIGSDISKKLDYFEMKIGRPIYDFVEIVYKCGDYHFDLNKNIEILIENLKPYILVFTNGMREKHSSANDKTISQFITEFLINFYQK